MRSPALQRARDSVPHCLAAVLFDLSDGTLLSAHTDAQMLDMQMSTAALAMRDLLRLASAKEKDAPAAEVVVASGDRVHVGMQTRTHEGYGVLFVCRADISVGMALARTRICLTEIEGDL